MPQKPLIFNEKFRLSRQWRKKVLIFSVLCLFFLSSGLDAGPSGDYGDAPVGDLMDGIEAYPGTISRFVTLYNHTNTIIAPQYNQGTYVNTGATFYIGFTPPSVKVDSQQDPNLPDNDACPLVLLEGTAANPGPNPLATMAFEVTTTSGHDPTSTMYMNVFIDQNRDGQWKDGFLEGTTVIAWNLEWVVQDLPVTQDANTTVMHTISQIRVADPTAPVWVRLILSDLPLGEMYRPAPINGTGFWDATMPSTNTAVGEIEDHLMNYYSDPTAMPTNGQRGCGIVLRRLLQPQPPPGWTKPECFLIFRKANYTRPLFENRRYVVLTPWCMNGGIDFGLEFGVMNVLGGCDPPANGIVGLYGHKLIDGRGMPPTITRTGVAGLGAPPLACPVGPPIVLPGAHPDNPADYPLVDQGVASIADLRAGVKWWNACYPDPPRYRRYASKVIAKSCGSEVYNHSVVPGKDDEEDYSQITSAIEPAPGNVVEVHWINGGLLEKFDDPSEPVPFPDPDFFDYELYLPSPSGSIAEIFPDDFVSPPTSFILGNAGYIVHPIIPEQTLPSHVGFYYKGSGGTLIITFTGGDTEAVEFEPNEEWTYFEYPIPDGLFLEQIEIDMTSGFIDDVSVGLNLARDDEPTFLDDCNNNGVIDQYDIEDGFSEDANGNEIPDECDGYVEPECGDTNSDSVIDISDAVFLINLVFVPGSPEPEPSWIGDVNCDGTVDISDAVYLINLVFVPESPEPCADCE